MGAFILKLRDRETGDVRTLEFPTREQRAEYNFDVHRYSYAMQDPDETERSGT